MNRINKALSRQDNKKAFEKTIALAINDIEKSIRAEILDAPLISLAPAPLCIQEESEVDAALYLQVKLSGYGSIKKKWKRVLLGTGFVEAIFQGLVVSSATQNPWLGFAVAAEEMGSEYLTWNGVDWLLGETFAPVTLEAQLVYQQRVIWQDSSFVTENEDALSDADKKDKSKQLAASLHAAETKLLSSLNNYLQKEIEHLNTAETITATDDAVFDF